MSKRESVARLQHIVARLQKSPATFEDIITSLKQASELESYDYVVSKRTFHRDIDDIKSLYQIEITYNRLEKVYYINNEGQPEISKRMFEALDTVRIQKLTNDLTDIIYFDKRRPRGTEHLYGLVHAIKNCYEVKFGYHKYWDQESSQRKVEPYVLKESRYRWYLIAKDKRDGKLKSFALDRMNKLTILKNQFVYPEGFNISEMYKNSFGIISSDWGEPQEVILSMTPYQGEFVKSLPLHDSQRVLKDDDKEFRISLNLVITEDFKMEILSMGPRVKVLSPESLVCDVKQAYKNALKQYRE